LFKNWYPLCTEPNAKIYMNEYTKDGWNKVVDFIRHEIRIGGNNVAFRIMPRMQWKGMGYY